MKMLMANRRKKMATIWFCIAVTMFLCAMLVAAYSVLTSYSEMIQNDKPEESEETTLHPQELTAEANRYGRFTDEEIIMAAKTVWGEAHGVESVMEQAAVVWCFLNRVEESGNSLGEVVSAPNQFAYSLNYPTVDDFGRNLKDRVLDVVARWEREQSGETGVGRVLPKGYLWFNGDGTHNYFRSDYESTKVVWEWRLPNPYGS